MGNCLKRELGIENEDQDEDSQKIKEMIERIKLIKKSFLNSHNSNALKSIKEREKKII